jgi:hypothetical protein
MSSNARAWLLDMAGIRFSWAKGSSALSVFSSRLEVLAVVRLDPCLTTEEMALRGLDAVLGGGRVERVLPGGRESFPLGLYNPYTAEVAIGGMPKTRTYSDRAPMELGEEGCLAEIQGDLIVVEGRCLEYIPVSPQAISRARGAYEELAGAGVH